MVGAQGLAGQAPEPIIPDGRFTESAWERAEVVGNDAIELSIVRGPDWLGFGLRTNPLFVATLCVEQGDEVHVLHASAAVGRARYRHDDGMWRLLESFEWALRGTNDDPVEPDARSAYLAREGWVAHTVQTGRPGHTEFLLDTRRFDEPVRVSVSLMMAAEPHPVDGWPVEAGQGCAAHDTVAGPPLGEIVFATDRWIRVER